MPSIPTELMHEMNQLMIAIAVLQHAELAAQIGADLLGQHYRPMTLAWLLNCAAFNAGVQHAGDEGGCADKTQLSLMKKTTQLIVQGD